MRYVENPHDLSNHEDDQGTVGGDAGKSSLSLVKKINVCGGNVKPFSCESNTEIQAIVIESRHSFTTAGHGVVSRKWLA